MSSTKRAFLGAFIGVIPILAACGNSSPDDSPAEPGWGQPEILADSAVFDSPVGVSLDGDAYGNAIAVWAPSDRDFAPVLARRYSATTGWGAVETVNPAGNRSVNTPTVRMNARGDAVSIWEGYSGLSASTAAAGGFWQPPAHLGQPSFGLWRWGLDDEGRALLLWPAGGRLLTRRLELGSGWAEATLVPGAAQVSALEAPALAVSRSGHALVVWLRTQTAGVYEEAWANAFDPSLGWSAPSRLGPEQPSTDVYFPQAFINSAGDGLVCWGERYAGPGGWLLHVRRYALGSGLGPGELLGPTAGAPMAAAIDPAGNVLVIYESGLGLRRQRHVTGSGWQPPEPVDGVGGYAAVPLDDFGNGWILWNERIDSNVVSIRSRHLASGVATGEVEEAAAPFTGYAFFRGTPLEANGGLSAAWFQRVPPVQPQDSERYKLVVNRFLVK